MLINTLVLFLRDILPLFLLVAMLMALSPRSSDRWYLTWLGKFALLGIILGSLMLKFVDVISNQFDGAGLEILVNCVNLMNYALVISLGWQSTRHLSPRYWNYLSGGLITLMLLQNGANFLIYFSGYWQQIDAPTVLLLGTLLGLGICMSLAVLLFFALLLSRQYFGPWMIMSLLVLFICGRIMDGLNLLVQVDLLPDTGSMWNSAKWIEDNSGTGHLLNALVGYEASPSLLQVLSYLCLGLLALVLFVSLKHKRLRSADQQTLENFL